MEVFNTILNQEVKRLFLVVWPPLGEEKLSDIDISIGFVFVNEPCKLCVISTNKDDMWTPCIRYEKIPKIILPWSTFNSRMLNWMKTEEQSDFNTEYYEVSDVDIFKNIVAHKVKSIEFVGIQNVINPFGIKVNFENDYIFSSPISDGNTIETSHFHRNENILNFDKIGETVTRKV
jgi:hypothetical protein